MVATEAANPVVAGVANPAVSELEAVGLFSTGEAAVAAAPAVAASEVAVVIVIEYWELQ